MAGEVQCSAVQFSAVKCSAVQCSAVQCSAVPCRAVQCSAVQCSAGQCSAVQYFEGEDTGKNDLILWDGGSQGRRGPGREGSIKLTLTYSDVK